MNPGHQLQHTSAATTAGQEYTQPAEATIPRAILLQMLNHLEYEQERLPGRRLRQSILILRHILKDNGTFFA